VLLFTRIYPKASYSMLMAYYSARFCLFSLTFLILIDMQNIENRKRKIGRKNTKYRAIQWYASYIEFKKKCRTAGGGKRER